MPLMASIGISCLTIHTKWSSASFPRFVKRQWTREKMCHVSLHHTRPYSQLFDASEQCCICTELVCTCSNLSWNVHAGMLSTHITPPWPLCSQSVRSGRAPSVHYTICTCIACYLMWLASYPGIPGCAKLRVNSSNAIRMCNSIQCLHRQNRRHDGWVWAWSGWSS